MKIVTNNCLEKRSIVSLVDSKNILIKSYCTKNCAALTIKSYINSKTCTWYGMKVDQNTLRLGGLREPYCSDNCHRAAGIAMFNYELRKGNF